MDSYLIDEQRQIHVCHDNPDCPGVEIENGAFKLKGYDGPVIEGDKCNADMQLRSGRFGKYFSCTKYPDCRNTRKLLRNGQAAPPRAAPIQMPELPCSQSDATFVLRDGAAGIFLAANTFPRSRETRSPQVADLKRHREELDPKFLYLADAPEFDNKGNPVIIRFSRKERVHYLSSQEEGQWTKWNGQYVDGKWVIKEPEKTKPKKVKSKKKAKPKKTKARKGPKGS